MGTVNTNFLPASTGLSLGNALQAWNATLANLIIQGLYQSIGFVASPAFAGSSQVSVFDMTLTGNVTASTLTGVKGIMFFILRQDATGSRTFAWPANVNGAPVIGSAANSITVATFVFDGTNAYSIGIAGFFP